MVLGIEFSVTKQEECLVYFDSSGTYWDIFVIALVPLILNLAHTALSVPIGRPLFRRIKEHFKKQIQSMANMQVEAYFPQFGFPPLFETQSSSIQEEAAHFRFLGLTYTSYLTTVSVVLIWGSMIYAFCIYAVTDPRHTWQDDGWKATINLKTVAVAFVGLASPILGRQVKNHADTVFKGEPIRYDLPRQYEVFVRIFILSVVFNLMMSCLFYPYFVLQSLIVATVICTYIAVIASMCCMIFPAIVLFGTLYGIIYSLFYGLIKIPSNICITRNSGSSKEERINAVINSLTFVVLSLAFHYVIYVVSLLWIFWWIGGVERMPFCLEQHISIAAVGFVVALPILGALLNCCWCGPEIDMKPIRDSKNSLSSSSQPEQNRDGLEHDDDDDEEGEDETEDVTIIRTKRISTSSGSKSTTEKATASEVSPLMPNESAGIAQTYGTDNDLP